MTSPTAPNTDEFLTIAEAAAEMRVSRSTLSRMIAEGIVPAIKYGSGRNAIYRIPRTRWEQLKAGTLAKTPTPQPDELIGRRTTRLAS
jgi:excisionase family DNA binding protein